jgi:hypothetical protein|tara:strand:+ start:1472 stop:1699 length:228 start_codon:yes stop_codon:yes gene_type:complete
MKQTDSNKELISLIKNYKIVFSSDDGKKVIEDLKKRCHELVTTHDKNNSHETAFLEGQRSVLIFIKSMINKNLEE